MPTLVIVDADRIHDYVFSPHRLKLIRGGSNIERTLNEDEMPLLCEPIEPISAGGGTALIEFADRSAAEQYCRRVEQAFFEKSATATVTWVAEEWDGSFVRTLDKAQAALALRKEGRTDPVFNGSSPYWKACEDCGQHPASEQYSDPDSRVRLCCTACDLRRKAGKRGEYVDKVAELAGKPLGDLNDLSELAAHSHPLNYLGMIYIDVDRLGRYLHDYGTEKERYGELSVRIREAVMGGVLAGCAKICDRVEKNGPPPFEIILIGGDDAIVFVAADRVFAFLDRFAECYEQTIAGLPRKESELTFSAGIVWANHHFPITQFRARAEDLVRSSKTKEGHRVDWSVVSESGIERLRVARKEACFEGLTPTRKPYTLEEFRKLAGQVKVWKRAGVPSTKVKALYPIAYLRHELSVFEYWTLYSRLRREHRTLFDGVFDGPGAPWEGAPDKYTKAADLVELWDFVPEEDA